MEKRFRITEVFLAILWVSSSSISSIPPPSLNLGDLRRWNGQTFKMAIMKLIFLFDLLVLGVGVSFLFFYGLSYVTMVITCQLFSMNPLRSKN